MEKEKNNEAESLGTAMSYDFTASDYLLQGEYDKALECYQNALAVTERILGKDHPHLNIEYHHIGDVYRYKGDYGKALKYFQKALFLREKSPNNEDYVTASLYSDVGDVYSELGDNDNALLYFQRSLAIREKIFTSDHALMAALYNKLAWTYHLTGKYVEALPWAEKATASFHNNPHIIDTLATVYQDLGRYDEAMAQFELCLKLCKEQESLDDIQESETKIAELKELMKNGGVSEQ